MTRKSCQRPPRIGLQLQTGGKAGLIAEKTPGDWSRKLASPLRRSSLTPETHLQAASKVNVHFIAQPLPSQSPPNRATWKASPA